MAASGRFPAPWSVEDTGAAFVVKDAAGQKLGYFYYEEESGRRTRRVKSTKSTPSLKSDYQNQTENKKQI